MTTTFSRTKELAVAALCFALAVVLGIVGNTIASGAAVPERGVVLAGVAFAVTAALLYVAWLAANGWRLAQDTASFGVFAVVLTGLVASYFTAELSSILFRADTLIW